MRLTIREVLCLKFTGGYVVDPLEGWGPLPKDLIGLYAQILGTGEVITEITEPGVQWGYFNTTQLREPLELMTLEVISPGKWLGNKLPVEGVTFRKLSPLEILALQSDE